MMVDKVFRVFTSTTFRKAFFLILIRYWLSPHFLY